MLVFSSFFITRFFLMFWRFGFHNASALEALIEKDGAKMDDIMGQEDLLQEIKGQNPKVMDLYCHLK
jgi:cellobiose-specific phosphotransferase system component IIC